MGAPEGWLLTWQKNRKHKHFSPKGLDFFLLAPFLGHTKIIAGGESGEMDSSHGHAVDVEIRVSPVPDGEGGSWRRLWPASIRHWFRRWIRRAELAAPPLPSAPANGIFRCHRSPLERRVGRARVIGQSIGTREDFGPSRSPASAWRSGRQHKPHKEQGATCFSRRSKERGEGGACRPRSARGPVRIGRRSLARVPCPSRRTCTGTVSVEADPELELGPRKGLQLPRGLVGFWFLSWAAPAVRRWSGLVWSGHVW